jgi:hypothetical protein
MPNIMAFYPSYKGFTLFIRFRTFGLHFYPGRPFFESAKKMPSNLLGYLTIEIR